MTPLTLELRETPSRRIDMSAFTAGDTPLPLKEVARLELVYGSQPTVLGDLFVIRGKDTDAIRIRGDTSKLDYLGAHMCFGSIDIEGNAGVYAGHAMRGGSLRIQGSCDVLAANQMSGGVLRIEGNAGDFLGGPLPGERNGMRGGEVVVNGNAGARLGERMRRGTILVKGDCADYCAARMVAGSIVVLGSAGEQTGVHMQRGTVLLTSTPENLPSTFNGPFTVDLGFLPLLLRSINRLGELEIPAHTRATRYVGDLACGGKGELLVLP